LQSDENSIGNVFYYGISGNVSSKKIDDGLINTISISKITNL